MRLSLRPVRPALLAGCLGLLIPTAAVTAAALSSFRVEDNAKMFSEKARDAADSKIDAIKTKYNKDVLIETFAKLPDEARKAFDRAEGKEEKRKFWANLADKRGESKGVEGVYLLITKEPTYLVIATGKGTGKRAFTDNDRREAEKNLIAHFEKKQFDQGLLDFVNDIELKFNSNIGPVKAQSGSAVGKAVPGRTDKAGGSMFSGIWGMVCVGLVVILGLWLVIGLFRAMTGAGSRPVDRPPGQYVQGGPGYGPSGGPGYAQGGPGYAQPSGGGGGGFMSSLFGGMLGAAAGNYVYDSFFRGSSHAPSGGGYSGGGSSAYAGGTPPAADPSDRQMTSDGGGDWSSGGTSAAETPDDGGGASFGRGDDGGGASFGGGDDGGGGDWGGGGGGDGGGGDWGGGGDSGGGGGGDW